ncbi:RNA polymerase subunit sigma-70 [Candidatus Allofournierella excrementavium]|uniref:RNA polymerase subunit sigma-70 n=1 Tax=Candidatus Allofournierella excrementavium TaxID=2838591 RepID=UPI003AF8BB88
MGFNYGYEKKKFDSRWKRLEVEYCDAGMSEEQIAAMKEYDWAWFCSQRVFQNHTQPIPCEQYDEVCGQSQLFRKFASLSYQWDVDKIDQTRYGWLASVENEQLLLRLKKLSKKDLELYSLQAFVSYSVGSMFPYQNSSRILIRYPPHRSALEG